VGNPWIFLFPEIEFLKGIFSHGFWVLSELIFCLVFYPLFLFYKMLFMNRLFVGFFKSASRGDFEQHRANDSSLLLN
jgi:hypothetical protein